jgi:hypothetical protein
MTRLLTTVAAATLLALPAFAQAPSASGTADQAPPGASGATIMPDSPSAKPKVKSSAKTEQSASEREMHAIAPAAGGKGKSAQRVDPESGQIAELNRQQLQQIESQPRQ